MTLIYEGSSKNVYDDSAHSAALFEFTDRYSVFDWGMMPDQLERKGEALAVMGKIFFDLLGKKGIQHHCLGLVSGSPRWMRVQPITVLRPEKSQEGYDYTPYQAMPTDCLVPLEVIFRFGAPAGSSLLKRYPQMKAGERFSRPFIEFTTKLEDEDRQLHEEEAMRVAGLTHRELQTLKEKTTQVALLLRDILALMNVELWDGKLEWAFSGRGRDFKLVDAIGLDELRVSFMGRPLSKEFLREHYRKTSWYQALEHSKDWVHLHGGDFKEICLNRFAEAPRPLPKEIKLAAEGLYLAFANDLSRVVTGEIPFDEKYQLVWWVKEYA